MELCQNIFNWISKINFYLNPYSVAYYRKEHENALKKHPP